jgi:hypothetical protein
LNLEIKIGRDVGGVEIAESCDFLSAVDPASRELLAETERESANECVCYSLIATPLKEATPMELEVAAGMRSP